MQFTAQGQREIISCDPQHDYLKKKRSCLETIVIAYVWMFASFTLENELSNRGTEG